MIDQVARGLYRWADAPEIDQDLLEIAHRAPQGTPCLVTALARHELTDIIPPRIDITLPRGSRIPSLRETIQVHVFARETFELGREGLGIGDKLSIFIYSPERTLVDVIRLRHREGSDVAWEALRGWTSRKGLRSRTIGIELDTHSRHARRHFVTCHGSPSRRCQRRRPHFAGAPARRFAAAAGWQFDGAWISVGNSAGVQASENVYMSCKAYAKCEIMVGAKV